MYIQINKEGRTRYKRKYFFPDAQRTQIYTDVSFKNEPFSYWGKFDVANFTFKTLSIAFRCPHCGLQMYGQWYRGEEFIARHSDGSCSFDGENYLDEYHLTFRELWPLAVQEKEAYTEVSKRIEAEIYAVRSMKTCPICGETLSQKFEEETENSDPHSYFLNDSFEQLVYQDDDYPGIGAKKTLQSIKDTIIPQDIDTDTKKLVSNPDLLQKYIKHLLNTEMTIQLLEKRHFSLCYSAYRYRREYIQEQAEQMSEIAGAQYAAANVKEPTMNDVVLRIAKPVEPQLTATPPNEPNYKTPGLFNKKKIQRQNELLRANYEADLQAYKHELAEYENELTAYSSALQKYTAEKQKAFECLLNNHKREAEAKRTSFIAGIERNKSKTINQLGTYALFQQTTEDIKRTEELLAQSYSCRQSLYSCEIIYEKYRNPVALASFYDYLAAGRCTSLTGADGAYNIYENEVRLDRIVTKLDVIIRKLDHIKDNQYSLYAVMSAMNSNLNTLNSTASAMADSLEKIKGYQKDIFKNTSVIAHNTAVTAFYAKKNAELTDALGFMVALK